MAIKCNNPLPNTFIFHFYYHVQIIINFFANLNKQIFIELLYSLFIIITIMKKGKSSSLYCIYIKYCIFRRLKMQSEILFLIPLFYKVLYLSAWNFSSGDLMLRLFSVILLCDQLKKNTINVCFFQRHFEKCGHQFKHLKPNIF